VKSPEVYTIPVHRAFADALAAGLIARFGKSETSLARGTILLPNNRAARAVTVAFVRRSEGGLLLPRLIPVGDPELDERAGGALEPLGEEEAIPAAIEPAERLFLLAKLIQQHQRADAGEALRLARDLARTLDQLLIEEVPPAELRRIAADQTDLSAHWQSSLDRLSIILDEWPRLLRERGRIDPAERRNRLLDALARRWRDKPPAGYVVGAGITTAAPAVARLLGTIARLPDGMVVLPGLDTGMAEKEWADLGRHDPDPVTGRRRPASETHPQFNLKLLLDRMSVGRGEVRPWRWGGGRDAPAVRRRAIANAMKAAPETAVWQDLPGSERRLTGVKALELADPAEEAQAVAIALREALEVPGRTAALVTPDRDLARRVSAHLRRWGIVADDSAGLPLSRTPPGTLLLNAATAGAEQFAPVPLLALLKHPLVRQGDARLDWLEGTRALDLTLRGPRPPAGLSGISAYLADPSRDRGKRDRASREQALGWWEEVTPLLEPLETTFDAAPSLSGQLETLREAVNRLAGDAVWAGPAGRALADFLLEVEEAAGLGPDLEDATSLSPLLEQLLGDVAVRPPFGQHPRIFIWGLIEARLQQADLMILAGLNEGIWPALPAPDPWLAPRIRHELGLPSLERRIGLAAHDFASSLGGREVLVTRARRDARSPAIASRFWLRLEAMTGGLTRLPHHARWAKALDKPAERHAAEQPKPSPDPAKRPRKISVTDVDRLKADPFAFYARKMLDLSRLDAIDADPSAAWRGTAVHDVLEAWMKEDDCDPAKLRPRAEALLASNASHPLMRALWQPRLLEAIDWIAETMAAQRSEGRVPIVAEAKGSIQLGEVTLEGRADRIDRSADGGLVIVDYKTGNPPGPKAVAEGFSMQLGLLGLIAEKGGFPDVEGVPAAFEYWSLARKSGALGFIANPTGKKPMAPGEFVTAAERQFLAAAAKWLTGSEPFTAKLHPEYAPYTEYDQLMRLGEWYGQERR
jgi:ATP-dependent helicase/nuclease subunit B